MFIEAIWLIDISLLVHTQRLYNPIAEFQTFNIMYACL